MDPLSEIFNSAHVTKAVFTRLYATAPWGFQAQRGPQLKFTLVLTGGGILETEAQPDPVRLSTGDVFIMLDDAAYSITDGSRAVMIDCEYVETLRVGNRIDIGGGGALTSFISGQFEIDRAGAGPILGVLPPLLHLKASESRTQAFQFVLEMLAAETDEPGLASETMISRLYEMLFIHAVRSYAQGCEAVHGGWLAGITDKQLGKTVRAIHADLRQDWTIETLAQHAGMSRSSFAARFKAVVRQTPFDYLTQWRMYKASALIRNSARTISEASYTVGYDSESAFTKVFKRQLGMTPREFRKRRAIEGDPLAINLSG
jgi:AraC-like DNA-binding protein